MKREFDLLSLGEIMLRLSPPDNERITRGDTFSKQAGGAELNSATGVAMLGLRCGIISKLPANDLGMYIKNRVRLCGVSDDYLVYDDSKDARRVFDTFSSTHMSLSQYWLYFFVKFKTTSSPLCVVVL